MSFSNVKIRHENITITTTRFNLYMHLYEIAEIMLRFFTLVIKIFCQFSIEFLCLRLDHMLNITLEGRNANKCAVS